MVPIVNEKKVKMGKKSRALGLSFENRVRADLESKGWIVAKWTNNVELAGDNPKPHEITNIIPRVTNMGMMRLVKTKNKWAGPGRPMMMGGGFPDFIAFKGDPEWPRLNINYEVIGVESKITGELDKQEKEKCKWLLDNNVFSKILIARKTKVKNKIVIVYEDFKEKYWRFYG